MDLGIVCYSCGSFDLKFLNENEKAYVYKCGSCGRVFVKSKFKRNGKDGNNTS